MLAQVMNKNTNRFLSTKLHPIGLLTAAGFVACSATLFGFLGRFSWFLDLFSHFRVQYLIGLGILGVLLLVARRFKTAVVFFTFASINLGFVLPLYLDGHVAEPEKAGTLRAMLINVNTRLGDAELVKQTIQEFDPDIIVLEEINARWVLDLQWLDNSHTHSCVQPREDNFGIGLFSKHPIAESEIVYIGDALVPSILATIDFGLDRLGVIATHPFPPWGAEYSRWRNQQLEDLPNYISSSLPLILLGDLNVTPWNYYFRKLLKRTELIDSSKGRGIQPTWPNYNPLLWIPIDQCLHSRDVIVLNKRIGADVGSDHYPVVVDFTILTEKRTTGPTKLLNTALEPTPNAAFKAAQDPGVTDIYNILIY
jgi:endonuclease/exonuclease/phosphatase (EEP) superfamily protein YafD